MNYTIQFKPQADRDLLKISPPTKQRILKKIAELALNPYQLGTQKLKGRKKQYRVRVGDYRILYEIFDDRLIVYVIRIAPRDTIYRD